MTENSEQVDVYLEFVPNGTAIWVHVVPRGEKPKHQFLEKFTKVVFAGTDPTKYGYDQEARFLDRRFSAVLAHYRYVDGEIIYLNTEELKKDALKRMREEKATWFS